MSLYNESYTYNNKYNIQPKHMQQSSKKDKPINRLFGSLDLIVMPHVQ